MLFVTKITKELDLILLVHVYGLICWKVTCGSQLLWREGAKQVAGPLGQVADQQRLAKVVPCQHSASSEQSRK